MGRRCCRRSRAAASCAACKLWERVRRGCRGMCRWKQLVVEGASSTDSASGAAIWAATPAPEGSAAGPSKPPQSAPPQLAPAALHRHGEQGAVPGRRCVGHASNDERDGSWRGGRLRGGGGGGGVRGAALGGWASVRFGWRHEKAGHPALEVGGGPLGWVRVILTGEGLAAQQAGQEQQQCGAHGVGSRNGSRGRRGATKAAAAALPPHRVRRCRRLLITVQSSSTAGWFNITRSLMACRMHRGTPTAYTMSVWREWARQALARSECKNH